VPLLVVALLVVALLVLPLLVVPSLDVPLLAVPLLAVPLVVLPLLVVPLLVVPLLFVPLLVVPVLFVPLLVVPLLFVPPEPVVPPVPAATVVKDAPTLWAAVSATVQLAALPEQAPVQPTNVLPDAGAAVKVTLAPLSNDFVHVPASVQLIPAGLEVTVPAPPIVTCSGSN
jgi:hypothetical protein